MSLLKPPLWQTAPEQPAHTRRSPLAARTAALLERARRPASPPPVADADLNRVHLTGRLGGEPRLVSVADHPVALLALGCQRRGVGAQGAQELETTWLTLTAWEELAEQCGRLLHAGDRIYVEGQLHQGEAHAPGPTIIIDRLVLLAPG